MDDMTLTRKSLLSLGALVAGGAVLGARGARAATLTAVDGAPSIDVHGHALTPTIEAALTARGNRIFEGRPLPTWSLDAARAFLDRQGLDLQLLSSPDPGLSLIAPDQHVAAARAINAELATLVEGGGGRFGGLAVLPLSAGANLAIAELRRALGRGLDGVILPTNVGARQLGDAAYRPLLSELSRRRTPVLVHPVAPASPDAWPETQGAAPDLLEHAFASVRCAASLLYGGSFVLAPNLRLLFAAGGGGLPFMASRVALADQALRGELFTRPLRQLAFDLAGAAGPGAVDATRAFVFRPQQIMYGSDWPLSPETPVSAAIDRLPADEAPIVGGQAALAMFPTLADRLVTAGR